MPTGRLLDIAGTLACLLFSAHTHAAVGPTIYEEDVALATSQAALGNRVRNQQFVRPDGSLGDLAQFSGRPLVLSLVYTSCNQICPMTTRNLAKAVSKARDALGGDSFSVVTAGFDSRFDTPDRMAFFAAQQDITDPNWHLISLSEEAVRELTRDVGFLFRKAAGGFEHLVQTTIIDGEGQVYRQVYGQAFNTPLLVDPLISLVLGRRDSAAGLLSTLRDKVRLYCTTYDPVRDGYYFDYSLFLGIIIGGAIIGLAGFFTLRELRGR